MDSLLLMLPPLLEGAGTTLKLFVITLLLSIPLGLALALLRLSGTPMPPPAQLASTLSWWQRLASLFTRKETT